MSERFYIESNGIWDTSRNKKLSWRELCDTLNELAEEKENNELKGKIINSLRKSRTVKCNCNPCVAEEAVIEMLMK